MKIGIAISIVTNMIPGEGGPTPSGTLLYNDDALTIQYFVNDSQTTAYSVKD